MKTFFVISVIVAVLGFFAAMLVISERKTEQFNVQCEAKGGIPHHLRDDGDVCFKPEAFINVNN